MTKSRYPENDLIATLISINKNKRRNEKTLSIILASLLTISMAACDTTQGSSSSENTGTVSIDTTEPSSSESATESSKAPFEAPEESSEAPAADSAETTISEQVIYDSEDIKVTATGLEVDDLFGPSISVLVENNSANDVIVQCSRCTINGYMMDTSMSVDIAAGKKANDSLTIMTTSLEECGISVIADIQVDLSILDPSTYQTLTTSGLIPIETSNSGTYIQSYNDAGTVIYEADGIKVVSQGISEDEIFGQELKLYIENNSENDVVIQCDNASVNGFMISAMFSSDVLPGMKAVDGITFLSDSLEENNITTIENIELSILVLDSETFSTIAESETTTLTF